MHVALDLCHPPGYPGNLRLAVLPRRRQRASACSPGPGEHAGPIRTRGSGFFLQAIRHRSTLGWGPVDVSDDPAGLIGSVQTFYIAAQILGEPPSRKGQPFFPEMSSFGSTGVSPCRPSRIVHPADFCGPPPTRPLPPAPRRPCTRESWPPDPAQQSSGRWRWPPGSENGQKLCPAAPVRLSRPRPRSLPDGR